MTSLLFAVGRDPINLDVVEELLKRGADVNLGDAKSVSPLLHLLTRRHDVNITAMMMLLENGADVNARAYCCNSAALHHALERPDCDENMIHLLLQHGAEVNAADDAQYTPLHYAVIKFVKESSLEEIQYDFWMLIDEERWTNLVSPHFELNNKECNERIVEQLLLRGAVVDAVNDFGETALHLAIKNPNCSENVIRLLLRNGANVNAECHLSLTPLLYAVQVKWDNESVIAELLKGGANSNIRCNKGISALHHAVRNPFCTLNVTKALLSQGALVGHPDRELMTPLHYAVDEMEEFKLDHIKELLRYGASVGAMDIYGVNPLGYALGDNRCPVELVRLLLKFTISENINRFIFPAVTCTRCPLDVREELLNHGIDVNYRNNDGHTLLDVILEDVCRYQFFPMYERSEVLHDKTNWIRLLLQKGYYVTNSCIWEKVIKNLLKNNMYFSKGAKAFEFLKFITKYALLQILRAIDFSTRRSRFETIDDEEVRWFATIFPGFSGGFLSSSYSSILSQFQRDCLAEIRAMAGTPFSGWVSLLAFLRSREVCSEEQTAEELVRILSSSQFPIYSDVITNRVDRAILIEILTEQKLSVEVASGDASPVLSPNCVFKIANYLSKEDIMKCILAFSHRNNYKEQV